MESARLNALWDEEDQKWLDDGLQPGMQARKPPPNSAMGAATWHGVQNFIEQYIMPHLDEEKFSDEKLSEIANGYKRVASELVGPMPAVVKCFVDSYAT